MFEKLGVRNNLIRLVKSNFSLYRIFLILLVILYELDSEFEWGFDYDLEEWLPIAIKNFTFFVIIPLLFSITTLIIFWIKDKRESKNIGNEYYREIIENISPVELSYLDDKNIEYKKDIIATLLELNLKKKIEITNDKIKIIDESDKNLTLHEGQVLKELGKKKKNFESKNFLKKFEKNLYNDLKKSELILPEKNISKSIEEKYLRNKKIYTIFAFGVLLALVLVRDAAIITGILVHAIFIPLSIKIVISKFGVYEPGEKNGKDVARALILCGGTFIPMFITALMMIYFYEEVTIFFKYFFLIVILAFIIADSYFILNINWLSAKGKKIKAQLCGLKLFLNDFSTMKSKDINEIGLWDEYIIYSVILNENKKITREVWRILKNTIGNN